MRTAHSRREAALDAIERVRRGGHAADVESEVIDFKEEAGTIDRDGGRAPIAARHEPAARALAAEAACFANSESGGVLIVGVNDQAAGPSAFVGAWLDATWLRSRIHALTQPGLAVDEIESLTLEAARVYLVNVAPALEEIRCDGKLRARFGTACEELSGDRARRFLERRRNYDWSAEPSGLRVSQADPAAIAAARRYYEDAGGTAPGSDLALLRRMGVVLGNERDPQLSRAGALLVGALDPGIDQVDLQIARVEGAASRVRLRGPAPLLLLFDRLWEALLNALPATSSVGGARRRPARALPEAAVREAIVNALMHRDYQQPRSRITILATGEPTDALKVRSPGSLPPGVKIERLLTVLSSPRSPALANAFRVLGLAEAEGVGIDTMYRLMLRDGHPPPSITEDGAAVVVRLAGGRVDPQVRAFFDDLERRDPVAGDDVRAHMAITELLSRTPLRPERLAEAAQCTVDEALDALSRLSRAGAVERLLDGSLTFRLARDARERLAGRIAYPTLHSAEERWQLIEAFLDVHGEIGRNDAAELLGVSASRASAILGELVRESNRLAFVGRQRGRGVRYRRA